MREALKKVNFASEVCNRKHCLDLNLCQANQWWWVLLCFRRLSAWPSLLIAASRTFSLPKNHCISYYWTFFSTLDHRGKSMLSPFVKLFLIKYAFSYTSHILLVFTSIFFLPQLHFWLAVCVYVLTVLDFLAIQFSSDSPHPPFHLQSHATRREPICHDSAQKSSRRLF